MKKSNYIPMVPVPEIPALEAGGAILRWKGHEKSSIWAGIPIPPITGWSFLPLFKD